MFFLPHILGGVAAQQFSLTPQLLGQGQSYISDGSGLSKRAYGNNYRNFLAGDDDDENQQFIYPSDYDDGSGDDDDSDDNDDNNGDSSNQFDLGPPSQSVVDLPSTTAITEYNPIRYVLKAGEYHVYALNVSSSLSSKSSLVDYYATANLCDMPSWDSSGESMRIQLATNLTDLTQASSSYNATAYYDYFMRGFANITFGNVTANSKSNSTAYLLIMAPTVSQVNQTGSDSAVNSNDTWTYEVGISTNEPLHQLFMNPNFYLVDTDFAHSLLVSGNMTHPVGPFGSSNNATNYTNELFYKSPSTYYGIQVYESTSPLSTRALTLDWSYCAVRTSSKLLLDTANAQISITNRGSGNLPKVQFFLSGLNKSTSYVAYLSETTNHTASVNASSTEIFGGKVFAGVNFTTKAETNCQIVFDLELCSDVAFAVPGNASVYSAQDLSLAYDSYAQSLFDSFNTSMQVIQCGSDVAASDRYSILRTCDDCRESYRQWLCATTIPRCQDASVDRSYLWLREVNTSRTDFINSVIQPGVYNEVLPCIDLCYGILQDCPSSFGFACPQQGLPGFDGAYYIKEGTTDITCNYPGVVYTPSSANRLLSLNIVWAVLLVLSIVCF